MNYKFICSCVRNFDKINIDVVWENLFEENHNPKPGDLMLVEVLDDTCGYDSVEDSYGRLVKLYDGDVFVAVLGNRMSGTNLVGSVPSHPLKRNDTIHLLAQGGIVGEILGVNNGHRGGKAMPLRVVGFLTDGERILNTVYEAEKKITNRNPAVHNKTIQKYFVMGTSAEVGKTTLVSRLIREIKETVPQKKIAVIKVCGTGRLKDKNQYKDAGSDFAYDFVDFGYPSTYAISPVEYMKLFDEMLFVVEQLADIIIVELGGDLYEANAPVAIKMSYCENCRRVLVVNDALGGIQGMQILRYDENKETTFIATWKQNSVALQRKLMVEPIINTSKKEDIRLLVEELKNEK